MSICGINAGVGALPMCSPQLPVVGVLCEAVTEVLGELAYNPLSQGVLFQADYYRDPARVNASAYLRNSELAQWNNEGNINEAYKQNWAKVQRFVWVKGTKDTVVWPREGEWWGAMSDLPGEEFTVVHTMKDTRWCTPYRPLHHSTAVVFLVPTLMISGHILGTRRTSSGSEQLTRRARTSLRVLTGSTSA
jgi:palmitoyl-protein thioesterase